MLLLKKDKIILLPRSNEEYESVKEIIKDNFFVENDLVFVVENSYEIIEKLKSINFENFYTINEYKNAMKQTFRQNKIQTFKLNYDWMSKENFMVLYSENIFDILSISKKKVDVRKNWKKIPMVYSSNNGNIFSFVKQNMVNIYGNESLNLIFEIILSENCLEVVYSLNDSFILIKTIKKLYLYDIFKGVKLVEYASQPYQVVKNSFFLETDKFLIKLLSDDDCKNVSFEEIKKKADKSFYSKASMGSDTKNAISWLVEFYNSTDIQTIIVYKNEIIISKKVQRNITNLNVKFSDKRVLIFIEKTEKEKEKIKVLKEYERRGRAYQKEVVEDEEEPEKLKDIKINFIEIYDGINISVKKLEAFNCLSVKKIFFSNSSTFAVVNEENEIFLFSVSKHLISLKKRISKIGDVLISLNGSSTVIYDDQSSNIEFYDNFELKSKYFHKNCTGIEWSQSKLYFASFSGSKDIGGCVQIFNNNGELLYRKNFSGLVKFLWRSYNEVSNKNREILLLENKEILLELLKKPEDDDDENNTFIIKEWKDYLLSKTKIKNISIDNKI